MSKHKTNSWIGCDEGFERYGSSCYKQIIEEDYYWSQEAKCDLLGASLWAPRKVGDLEMIQEIFQ